MENKEKLNYRENVQTKVSKAVCWRSNVDKEVQNREKKELQ